MCSDKITQLARGIARRILGLPRHNSPPAPLRAEFYAPVAGVARGIRPRGLGFSRPTGAARAGAGSGVRRGVASALVWGILVTIFCHRLAILPNFYRKVVCGV